MNTKYFVRIWFIAQIRTFFWRLCRRQFRPFSMYPSLVCETICRNWTVWVEMSLPLNQNTSNVLVRILKKAMACPAERDNFFLFFSSTTLQLNSHYSRFYCECRPNLFFFSLLLTFDSEFYALSPYTTPASNKNKKKTKITSHNAHEIIRCYFYD